MLRSARVLDTRSAASRHIVYLRGKGLHELTVPFIVSVRKQLNQERLQLTIPAAAASQLTLRVPKERSSTSTDSGAG